MHAVASCLAASRFQGFGGVNSGSKGFRGSMVLRDLRFERVYGRGSRFSWVQGCGLTRAVGL